MSPASNGNPAPAAAGGDPSTVFASLASIIYAADDFYEVYRAIVNAAPVLVTACDHASIMLRQNGRFLTAAASSEVARQIDRVERELHEGPCVDAILEEAAQVDADLTEDSPWPELADRVLDQTTVRGMAGFRLMAGEEKVGALNFFSETPGALTGEAIDQASVLAAFASVAILAVHSQEQAATLKSGLQSNREIGKAIGLLMAFHKVGDDEAFDILRKTSQDLNVKLPTIAGEVVAYHNKP